jgi:pimeloyl-ACP methyl ester carboxylesterase
VVCHGFTHHTSREPTRRLLDALARQAPVVAFDLRGHGRSGGRSSVGDTEVRDVDAAVAWAHAAGHRQVVTVGFSLGGAIALRHAALGVTRPDAVVAVSPPARWYSRETPAMRRVHWLLEQPLGRLAARLIGVRLDVEWETVPRSPVEVAADIAPLPLLLVTFDDDHYFSPEHARALALASGHAELWNEPGGGHGESGTGDALAGRIAEWALAAAARTTHGDAGTRPPVGAESDASTVGARPAECRVSGSEVG